MELSVDSRRSAGARRFLGPALILLAAIAAITPQLIRGNSCGHDLNFHFFSWLDAQQSWRQGILYPRWAPSPDYGAGEPRFIFYPPLSWMAGAALGFVLPWDLVPIALTFLLLAGTGLAVRALAREVLEDGPATLAGCAAMLFGYALFTAYERTAFAELTGGIWVPLVMLYMLRDRNPSASVLTRAVDGSAALLAMPLAAAWLSDAPLGVMASYLLAAMALALGLLTRSLAPIIRAAIATPLGLGVAAVYIVPAVWEQRWVAISRTTGELGYKIQGNWLFARHSDPNLAFHDAVLHQVSVIAVAMVAITLFAVLMSWRRSGPPGPRKWWLPLAAIPLVVLSLQLPISMPVWSLLPELHFMQFPWRWLVAVEAPMGIFFAAAVWPAHRRWRLAVITLCVALFALGTVWAGRFWFQPCYEEDTVAAMLSRFRTGTVLDNSSQFAPPDTNDNLLALGLPDACLVSNPSVVLGTPTSDDGTVQWNSAQGSCEATFSASPLPGQAPSEHKLIHAQVDHPGYLILRLRTYPAWHVSVNGKTIADLPHRNDGLMAVPVPKGPVGLAISWTATPDIIAGRTISLISVLLLTLLSAWERKRSLSRL